MATTLLEIVDSAVKIGLGALISAVATYLGTRRSQRHETAKMLRDDRKGILREIALHIEASETSLNLFVVATLPGAVSQDHLKEIALATSKAGQALALASLAGSTELLAEIQTYTKSHHHLYEFFRDAKVGDSLEGANTILLAIGASSSKVYALLGKAHEATFRDS